MDYAKFSKSKCQFDDYGLLISWFSGNTGSVMKVAEHLRKTAARYKSNLAQQCHLYKQNAQSAEEAEAKKFVQKKMTGLYEPHLYHVFRNFDVLSLMLVDDFEVATRVTNPNATSMQLTMNALPHWDRQPDRGQGSLVARPYEFYGGLENESETEGNRPGALRDLPLVAVSLLKMNPVLLIDRGNEIVRAALTLLAQKGMAPNGDLKYTLAESLGWNEITIVAHGRDYSKILAPLLFIRERTVGDLFQAEEDAFRYAKNIFDSGGLVSDVYNSPEDLLATNLFSTSWTTTGFEFGLFEKLQEHCIKNPDEPIENGFRAAEDILPNIEGHLFPLTKLSGLPGSFQEIIDNLINKDLLEGPCSQTSSRNGRRVIPKSDHPIIMIGKYDQAIQLSSLQKHSELPLQATKHFFYEFARATTTLGGSILEDPIDLAYRTSTELVVPVEPWPGSLDKKRESVRLPLGFWDKLQIIKDFELDLEPIRNHCKALGLPKHIITEFKHILSMFNNHVRDPIVFVDVCFSMRPFLDHLIKILATLAKEPDQMSVTDRRILYDHFKSAIQLFNIGFFNRYNASFPNSELPDLSLEFKGGIQHLLNALDGYMRSVMSAIEDEDQTDEVRSCWNRNLAGFTVIGGEPFVRTKPLWPGCIVMANPSTMFQPEWFAFFSHEVFHYLITLWDLRKVRDIFNKFDTQFTSTIIDHFIKDFHTRVKLSQDKDHSPPSERRYLEDLWGQEARKILVGAKRVDSDQVDGPPVNYSQNPFIEEIAADQFMYDVGFGGKCEGLYRQVYWRFFETTISQSALFGDNDKKILTRDMCIRYILTVSPKIEECYINSECDFKNQFLGILKNCHKFCDADEEMTRLVSQDEATNSIAWKKLHDRFAAFCRARLELNEPVFKALDSLGQDSRALLRELGYPVAGYLRSDQFLQVLRYTLWRKAKDASYQDADPSNQKRYDPQTGAVGTFSPAAGQSYQSLAYCRETVLAYLDFLFQKQPTPLRRKHPTQDIEFHTGDPTLMFDALGGSFTADPEFRVQYFKARVAFIFSVWDTSAKMQGEQVKLILKDSDSV